MTMDNGTDTSDEGNIVKLRDIFDICDADKTGYISVEHFVNLAKQHFDSDSWLSYKESISQIVRVLDPEENGKIHFDDFCEGVRKIMQLKPPSNDYSTYCDSQLTLVHSDDICDGKTCDNTETDQYDATEDYESVLCARSNIYKMQSSIHVGSSEDDRDSGFSNKSVETNHHQSHVVCHHPSDMYYGNGGPDDERYGTIGYLYPGSMSKKLTPNAIASQLYRAEQSCASSFSDGLPDDSDVSYYDLSDKVKVLEEQVEHLKEVQEQDGQKRLKLKEENVNLVERIHLLEEQIREMDFRAQEREAEEERKHRELLSKSDNEKSREIEFLQQSLQLLERECSMLREQTPVLKADNERLRKDNQQLEKELQSVQQQLYQVTDEHQSLKDRMQADQSKKGQEKKFHMQLVDELSKELEELRLFKAEVQGHRRSQSSSSDLSRSLRKELESQIIWLKQENDGKRTAGGCPDTAAAETC